MVASWSGLTYVVARELATTNVDHRRPAEEFPTFVEPCVDSTLKRDFVGWCRNVSRYKVIAGAATHQAPCGGVEGVTAAPGAGLAPGHTLWLCDFDERRAHDTRRREWRPPYG